MTGLTNEAQLALARNGRTDWTIIIGTQADPAERHAADELARFLQEISGVSFPIRDDCTAAGGVSGEILVGRSNRLSDSDLSPAGRPLGADGFRIAARQNRLLIIGGSPRGTLYGVYAFLEKYLDCRWFTPEISRIPPRSEILLPEFDDEQIPAFEYREVLIYDAMDPDWVARNRLNGSNYHLPDSHGGTISYARFVHTFKDIVPPDEYFDSHPEYFSEVDGRRLRRNSQLCLTNPDVLALAVAKVRLWLQENPKARIVSVSQNDCYNPCQCDRCRQIDEEEGSHSGTLIRFVNAVARTIAPEYPDVFIDTLAYQYTRQAPRHTRPEANVIVRLCSIECCFSHPLESCTVVSWPFDRLARSPAGFADDLRAWAQTGARVYIWDYITNFAHYLAPFPNLRVLGPNLRFLAGLGVRGVFEQGAYQSLGGEQSPLKAYVLARLLWDPYRDEQALIREFLEGCYGRSAGPIGAYIRLLHDHGQFSHFGIYSPPTQLNLSPALLDEADRLFDEAEDLAEQTAVRQRVRAARIPVRYARLYLTAAEHPDYPRLLKVFLEEVANAGIIYVSEFLTAADAKALFAQGLTPAQVEAKRLAEIEQTL